MNSRGESLDVRLQELADADWDQKWVNTDLALVDKPGFFGRFVYWIFGKPAEFGLEAVAAKVSELVKGRAFRREHKQTLLELKGKLGKGKFTGRLDSASMAVQKAIGRIPAKTVKSESGLSGSSTQSKNTGGSHQKDKNSRIHREVADDGVKKVPTVGAHVSKVSQVIAKLEARAALAKYRLELPCSAMKIISKLSVLRSMSGDEERQWKMAVVKKYGEIDLSSQEPSVVRDVFRLRLKAVGFAEKEKVAKVLLLFDYLRSIEKEAAKQIQDWNLSPRVSVESAMDRFMAKKGKELGTAVAGRRAELVKALNARKDSDFNWLECYAMDEVRQGRASWLEAKDENRVIHANQYEVDENQLGGRLCYHSALEAHVFRVAYPTGSDDNLRAWLTRDRSQASGVKYNPVVQPFSKLVIRDTANYLAKPVTVDAERWRELSPTALDRYGLEKRQVRMPTDKKQTPERVVDWLAKQSRLLKDTNGSFILTWMWPGSESGHAIQVDFGKGRHGFWDADRGRFTWAKNSMEFRQALVDYLRAFGGTGEYRIDIPRLKKA